MTVNQKTWVEKYRPSKVKDIILPSRIMLNLENALDNIRKSDNQLPNLILHSQSAGTGKSSGLSGIGDRRVCVSYPQIRRRCNGRH